MSNKTKETILQVEHEDLIKMAAANNVTPYKSGATGMQCNFCLPNGRIWLIVWCESVPPVNVTIHDGEVGAIIHDQI